MGQEASSDAPPPAPESLPSPLPHNASAAGVGIDVNSLWGWRIMRVFRGSPSSRAGLAAFEDFILAIDGVLVDGAGALGTRLAAAENTPVSLTVWNCVDEVERVVKMTPAKWSGGPGLLGAAVRHEAVAGAAEHVWRVVDVYPGSPADDAGLVPRTDFIVGTTAEVFRAGGVLSALMKDGAKKGIAVSVLVYSTSTARTRTVEIVPSTGWGGEGVLGCELATGLLHKITREGE